MGRKKEAGVTLSPKYGLNPTMGKCFWCGGDTGEIALLGRLPGDKEAPRHTVLGYQPCDKCAEGWRAGAVVIEVDTFVHDGKPPISKDDEGKKVYPTGRYVVINPEFHPEMKAGLVFLMGSKDFSSTFKDVLEDKQAGEEESP